MLACRRVTKTPHFLMPSTDSLLAARSGYGHAKGLWMPCRRDAILKEMESWTSIHHDDDEMMAGIALQD